MGSIIVLDTHVKPAVVVWGPQDFNPDTYKAAREVAQKYAAVHGRSAHLMSGDIDIHEAPVVEPVAPVDDAHAQTLGVVPGVNPRGWEELLKHPGPADDDDTGPARQEREHILPPLRKK